jgi:hypothetical protein
LNVKIIISGAVMSDPFDALGYPFDDFLIVDADLLGAAGVPKYSDDAFVLAPRTKAFDEVRTIGRVKTLDGAEVSECVGECV